MWPTVHRPVCNHTAAPVIALLQSEHVQTHVIASFTGEILNILGFLGFALGLCFRLTLGFGVHLNVNRG